MDSNDLKRRTTRRLFLLALLGLLVLAGVVGWLVMDVGRIRPGMARADVVARLGPPDGSMLAIQGTPINETVFVWNERGFVIEFDDDDRVREVSQAPSLFDNLRNKLGF